MGEAAYYKPQEEAKVSFALVLPSRGDTGTGEVTYSKPQGEAKVLLGWLKNVITFH